MKMYIKKIMCLLLEGIILVGMLPMIAVAVEAETGNFSVQMLDTAENTEIRKNIAETVEIPVKVNHVDNSRTYNSFDITFSYDTSVLELVTEGIGAVSVISDSGRVRVLRYGADLKVGSSVFALKFNVKNPGKTTIKVTEAKIGIKQTAQNKDASSATIVNSVTIVTNSVVTFDSKGGSAVNAQTVAYGEKLQKPEDPIRKNYLFKGWYEDLNAESAWDFEKNTVTKEALTLYAKWGGYNVNVSSTSGGNVSVSHNEAVGGEKVEITVTPDSGYQMKTLTVTDAQGKNVTILTDNNGKYSFVMPEGDVTVKVTFAAKSTSKEDDGNPKTGDEFNLIAYSTMALTCLLAMLVLILYKKKVYWK
mgnify:CR=1 FL=1